MGWSSDRRAEMIRKRQEERARSISRVLPRCYHGGCDLCSVPWSEPLPGPVYRMSDERDPVLNLLRAGAEKGRPE